MSDHSQNRDFPVGEFPYLVYEAITEVGTYVQAPMAMSSSSILSVMAAAVQQVADVALPMGAVRPTSLFTMVIAESGERKSTVDDLLAKPLREHDAIAERRFAEQYKDFAKEFERWKMIRTAQIRGLAKLAGKGEATSSREQALADLDFRQPIAPRLRRLVRQDMTHAAIMTALEGDGESIFVCASEGGAVLKSDLVQNHFAGMSMAWGGESISTDRASNGRLAVNPRCTLAVMVQDVVLRKFFAKRGDVLRGSGFIARCLVARPQTTIGYRIAFSEPPQWHSLGLFHARLHELLDEGEMRLVSDAPRRIIEFDTDASRCWARHANEVEVMMRPGGYLAEVADFGAKLMEHVARVAAILHVFSRQEGRITVDTVERAFAIVWYFAEEFRVLFSPSLEIPAALIDAEKLWNYLQLNYWARGWGAVRRNDVLRCGPIRGRNRFDPAIDALISQGRIHLMQSLPKAPVFIHLDEAYFVTPQYLR